MHYSSCMVHHARASFNTVWIMHLASCSILLQSLQVKMIILMGFFCRIIHNTCLGNQRVLCWFPKHDFFLNFDFLAVLISAGYFIVLLWSSNYDTPFSKVFCQLNFDGVSWLIQKLKIQVDYKYEIEIRCMSCSLYFEKTLNHHVHAWTLTGLLCT